MGVGILIVASFEIHCLKTPRACRTDDEVTVSPGTFFFTIGFAYGRSLES